VELPLERAGAVEGVVLLADGTPAANASVNACVTYVSGPGSTSSRSLSDASVHCNAKGEFAYVPAPLGQTIKVTVTVDSAVQSAEVRLTEWRPVAHLELKFAKGIDVSVLVQDPQGRPVPNVPLTLSCGIDFNVGVSTDAVGGCLFRGIDPGQRYQITAKPQALLQQEQALLKVDGSENILRLKEGVSLEGMVQFADSGMPVPGVRVYACLIAQDQVSSGRFCQAETNADSEGKFRFTNLCPGRFCLGAGSGVSFGVINGVPGIMPGVSTEGTEQERTFTAGQGQPAVIKVKRGEGKALK
jgi:hypothetical protein